MWVIKFPDGHGYFNAENGVTPHLSKAKIYRSEVLVKTSLHGYILQQIQKQVGQGKAQYVQLVEA